MTPTHIGFGVIVVFTVGFLTWAAASIARQEGAIPAWWGTRRANRLALNRAGYALGWATMAFDVHVRCPDCNEAIRMCMRPVEQSAFNGSRIVKVKCVAVACLRCGYIERGDLADAGRCDVANRREPIPCV